MAVGHGETETSPSKTCKTKQWNTTLVFHRDARTPLYSYESIKAIPSRHLSSTNSP
jgi:hypothetical protein